MCTLLYSKLFSLRLHVHFFSRCKLEA